MIEPLSLLSNFTALDLSFLQQPPASTLFILVLSTAISLVTSIANRMVIDMEEFKRWTVESHHLRQELMDAMRSGNKRRIAMAQQRQQQLSKTQQRITMSRMKITLFSFVPIILIWQVLINFYRGVTIAYLPFEAPWIGSRLPVSTWYIICSISTNILLSRTLGLTFEIEPREG